jgi:hypothetical protein
MVLQGLSTAAIAHRSHRESWDAIDSPSSSDVAVDAPHRWASAIKTLPGATPAHPRALAIDLAAGKPTSPRQLQPRWPPHVHAVCRSDLGWPSHHWLWAGPTLAGLGANAGPGLCGDFNPISKWFNEQKECFPIWNSIEICINVQKLQSKFCTNTPRQIYSLNLMKFHFVHFLASKKFL